MRTLGGVIPALVTPFAPDDQVNVAVLRALIDYLIGKRVDGFYLCGSTGEGAFLSVEERLLVVKTVSDQVRGRVPLIVHVGAASAKEAVRLAQHARANGAAGISSILPPVLYDTRGIVAYYETIAAAAPDLPFFPYLFGGARDAVAFMRDLMRIPNLGGTKYTGPNMYELSHLVALRDHEWTVMSGMDEQCLFALMFGACGNIGSTLNLMPGAYREIHDGYHAGAVMRALDLQKRVNQVIDILLAFGLAGSLKAALGFLGFDCGNPRVPNLPLAEAKVTALHAALQSAGFFELAAM